MTVTVSAKSGKSLTSLSGITRWLEAHPEVAYRTSAGEGGTLVFHIAS